MSAGRRGFLWVAVTCFIVAALVLVSALFGAQTISTQVSPDGKLIVDPGVSNPGRVDRPSDAIVWGDWPTLDWKNVWITDRGRSCQIYELIEASNALREYIEHPTTTTCACDCRDAAIERWNKALVECEKVVGVAR